MIRRLQSWEGFLFLVLIVIIAGNSWLSPKQAPTRME
jgi:hypothetical protein